MSDKPVNKTAEQIFNSAANIDSPDERSAYLDQECGSNPALRAEVEELLRHDADAGSFLEKPPQELEATAGSELSGIDYDEAWRDLLTLSDAKDCSGTLGPYEIVEHIGRGGMGVVLRARDPKLNRIVAIKLLAPELAANTMSLTQVEVQASATQDLRQRGH